VCELECVCMLECVCVGVCVCVGSVCQCVCVKKERERLREREREIDRVRGRRGRVRESRGFEHLRMHSVCSCAHTPVCVLIFKKMKKALSS